MGVLFWIGLGKEDKTSLPSPLIGKPFPEFNLDVVEDGRHLTTADLKGAPVLVNVWATWCPTCKAEHAFLTDCRNRPATAGLSAYRLCS